MTVLDYILDGIEAELALERELGVRSIECDRGVLVALQNDCGPLRASAPTTVGRDCGAVGTPRPTTYEFVFLHDRALSEGGVSMMAKIIRAMDKTPESAPIVFTGDLPSAKVYVVLGGNALKKWFPGAHAGPNQWLVHEGKEILVTYSPEYILRFGEVTSTVKRIKAEMWNQLKAVSAKVRIE